MTKNTLSYLISALAIVISMFTCSRAWAQESTLDPVYQKPWTIDLSWISGDNLALTRWMDVGPGTTVRRALLIWLPYSELISVAVLHPTRSGYLGAIVHPGICFEGWTRVPLGFGVSNLDKEDINLDGIDDFSITLNTADQISWKAKNTLTVWEGKPLAYCK